MSSQKIDLIRQALSAAESSIKLSKQLLNDLEKGDSRGDSKPAAKEMPGILGTFDGQELVTQAGEKYPVPENYASKSILVVGDTLKLVEEGKEKRFKQIEHVKRHKTTGILTKKDGKWTAVSSEGSYKLLPAAVAHFEGNVGDEALLQLPANNLQVPWAAVEKVTKKADGNSADKPKEEVKAAVKEEKKEEPKPVVAEVKAEKPKVEAKPEEKSQQPKEAKEVKSEPKPEPKVEKKAESPLREAVDTKPSKEEPKAAPVSQPAKIEKESQPVPVVAKAPEPAAATASTEPKPVPAQVEEEEELA